MIYTPTHRFNGTDQLNGSRHPLVGRTCELVEQTGMSRAGYNCVVRLPREEWVACMSAEDEKFGYDYWHDFLENNEHLLSPDRRWVLQEANLEEELEAI